MNAKRFAVLFVLPVVLGICVLGRGGDKKDSAPTWKKLLPKDAYRELVRREVKIVEKLMTSDDYDIVQRAKTAALMIAAYTLSSKDGDNLEAVRNAALRLAMVVGDKSKLDEAKKLAAAIASLKGDASAETNGMNFKKYVNNDYYLMVQYMAKKKGGDGLHPELQFSSRLRGTQEYIENLFSYVSRRPLKDKYLDKAAKELELTAYRTFVSGQLIAAYQPTRKSKKRDPVVWRKTSTAMIAAALDMADAAHKKDAVALQKASAAVLDSCVKCHQVFQ